MNYFDRFELLMESGIITQLAEGLHDPGALKAIFLAGGTGSGKSFVSREIFGIEDLPLNQFSAFGLKVLSSDISFEKFLKDANLSADLDALQYDNPSGYMDAMDLFHKSKRLVKSKEKHLVNGRVGVIIDGTAWNYYKIASQKEQLENLGYDTYMVFVNTDQETALRRNSMRPRKVPESFAREAWEGAQENMRRYQSAFGRNFLEVDNSKARTSGEKLPKEAYRAVVKWIKQPVQNPTGKKWLAHEKERVRRP